MKKVNIGIVLFVMVVILLCSCSNNNINSSVSTESGNHTIYFDSNSDQLNFTKSLGVFPSMVATESGYYFTIGNGSVKYLCYTDKATMQTTVLCNKPDCLHINETNRKKRENCNAYLGANNTRKMGDLLFYGSNLYYFRAMLPDDRSMRYFLSQISLDGTQRKDVFTFKEYPQYIIIHRGYLYYTVADWGFKNVDGDPSINKFWLYRVPMNDLGKAPELIYEINGIQAAIGNPMGYEDGVYFDCSNYLDAEMQKKNRYLLRYDIESGTISTISDDAGQSAICAGRLVYSIDDEHKAICDLDGTNKKILKGVTGNLYCDDKYILTDTIYMELAGAKDKRGNPVKRYLYAYDLNGKELQAFSLEEYGGANIFGSDNDYIFLTSSVYKNEYESTLEYWRIDKRKIANGSAAMEKFYSIEMKTGRE